MVDIVVQRAEPGCVMVVVGDVDLATAPQLREAIGDLLAEDPPPPIRVDLTGVPALDSTGVFALVDGYKRANERGVRLTVEHPQQAVHRVLEICGLLDILTER